MDKFADLLGKPKTAVSEMVKANKLPIIELRDPCKPKARAGEKWVFIPEFNRAVREAFYTGRADIYTETPVKVSGFKRVIDEQDWTITKVTHFLNNSGFTTSLELEVRLSDVEYETEDDE